MASINLNHKSSPFRVNSASFVPTLYYNKRQTQLLRTNVHNRI